MSATQIPEVVARAVKVKSKHERWILEVECPFCKWTHQHGAGAVVQGHDAPMDSMYGKRLAVCHKEFYFLVKGDVKV